MSEADLEVTEADEAGDFDNEGAEAVSPARAARIQARELLVGVSGLSADQKRARLEQARDLLDEALAAV